MNICWLFASQTTYWKIASYIHVPDSEVGWVFCLLLASISQVTVYCRAAGTNQSWSSCGCGNGREWAWPHLRHCWAYIIDDHLVTACPRHFGSLWLLLTASYARWWLKLMAYKSLHGHTCKCTSSKAWQPGPAQPPSFRWPCTYTL